MTPPAGTAGHPDAVSPRCPSIFRSCEWMVAAFSTRRGGVSSSHWASLNLGESVGDDPENVRRNRERFFTALGLDPARVAFARQVHGATVQVVDQPGTFADCDGLVTGTPNLALALKGADCAIVLLADPDARIIGAAHAGWRGLLAGVAAATLDRMRDLGAHPGRTLAYVSPCLSVDRFEVGEEVACQFPAALVHRPPGQSKPHLNLKRGLRDQLLEGGLVEAHVEVDPGCTASSPELYFSHRTFNGLTGRQLGAVAMRPLPGGSK